MAARTKSSATSSQRPFSASRRKTLMDFSFTRGTDASAQFGLAHISPTITPSRPGANSRATTTGRDPAHWEQFAELGLLAAPLPEAYGGLGGGAVDTHDRDGGIRPRAGRRTLVPTVVIGGGFLKHGGNDAQKTEWLPKIAGGETIMAFAFAEPKGRYNLADLDDDGEEAGRRLCAERPEGRRDRRALGRPAHRHGAHRRRPARQERHQRLHRGQERQGRFVRATIRRSTACALRKSPSRTSKYRLTS